MALIDLYSDGTALSSSGTQSANNMHVRFPNIMGHSETWYEVRIVPTVFMEDANYSQGELKH